MPWRCAQDSAALTTALPGPALGPPVHDAPDSSKPPPRAARSTVATRAFA